MILELEIEEDASTSTKTSTSSSTPSTDRIDQNNINNKKVVSFNEDVIVHEVTHLKDIDEQTKKDVWYTELYLRMMRCNMMPGNDGDDDDGDYDNSNDDTLQSFMKARNIRRSRQLVMAEQARQKRYTNSNSNGNGNDGRDGETLIQNEYCRVATTSQADATQRGRVMASKALKIRRRQQQQQQ